MGHFEHKLEVPTQFSVWFIFIYQNSAKIGR